MSTLKKADFDVMDEQIELAKDTKISKEKVLGILHEKLKAVDIKNDMIVDRIDGVAIKEVLALINKISD